MLSQLLSKHRAEALRREMEKRQMKEETQPQP
jgi:hypothetical protein